MSLSARRAWIEISKLQRSIDIISVALRKESVDRNRVFYWLKVTEAEVALRKESVDRNIFCSMMNTNIESRSPQGERG